MKKLFLLLLICGACTNKYEYLSGRVVNDEFGCRYVVHPVVPGNEVELTQIVDLNCPREKW